MASSSSSTVATTKKLRRLSEFQQDEAFLLEFYRQTIEENPYIPKRTADDYPFKAHPKQIQFLTRFEQEVFFGGAGGGGKTDAILMGAVQFMHLVPNIHSLILRNASPDLKQADGLVARAHEWFGHLITNKPGGVSWNEQQKTFSFPNGGTIRMGQMELEKDKYKFRGGAYQYIAFDELTLFLQEMYTYLFSRKRRLKDRPNFFLPIKFKGETIKFEVPDRMRSASNPGGRGHGWVKQRFVKPGDLSRPFIPASRWDNPSLDNENYTHSLANMNVFERRQIDEGCWDDMEGGRFLKQWFREWSAYQDTEGVLRFRLHERPAASFCEPKPAGSARGIQAHSCWRFIVVDPAASVKTSADYTAIGVFCVTPNKDLLMLDMIRVQTRVENIVEEVAKACADYSPLWVGIEDAGFQTAIIAQARRHPQIPAVRSLKHEGKDKLVRATPAINRAAEGQIYLPPPTSQYPWVEDFITELICFTGDETKDSNDDQVDVLAYACLYLDKFGLAPPRVITIPQVKETGYNFGRTHDGPRLIGYDKTLDAGYSFGRR